LIIAALLFAHLLELFVGGFEFSPSCRVLVHTPQALPVCAKYSGFALAD
jgi:hypothetical protein